MKLAEGAWSGQPAFLIGGGPSIASIDWRLLAGVPNVVCVNASVFFVPTAAAVFSEDERFFLKFADQLADFKGEIIYHALAPELAALVRKAIPRVTIIERKRTDKFWSKSFADGLSYSSNSAVGALNVLDLLDAQPIYLLGIDCNPTKGANPNGHELYPQDWRAGDDQLKSFKSDFELWCKPNLRGRVVVNLNSSSGVTCWTRSKLSYNEALTILLDKPQAIACPTCGHGALVCSCLRDAFARNYSTHVGRVEVTCRLPWPRKP